MQENSHMILNKRLHLKICSPLTATKQDSITKYNLSKESRYLHKLDSLFRYTETSVNTYLEAKWLIRP